MRRLIVATLLALICVPRAKAADQRDVQEIIEAYRSVRPSADDLELYKLDWMSSLATAHERAAKERRPIFLIVVTNSFGDIASGHC